MKFFYQENDAEAITAKVMEALGGRELGKMVSFSMDGDRLKVVISKMGTSTLEFAPVEKDGGLEFSLSSEKIAMMHKAFKGEVTQKLAKVIEKTGGKILDAGR